MLWVLGLYGHTAEPQSRQSDDFTNPVYEKNKAI